MNARLILSIAAALVISSSAQAHDQHALTRADVIAEYQAAKAAGTLLPQGDRYPGDQYFTSTRTRAEVIEETRIAIAHGDVAHGENYPRFADPVSTKTRAQVKEELAQSRRTHKLVNDELVTN